MKKSMAFLTLIFSISFSCNKDDVAGRLARPCENNSASADYRCAYVGDYVFSVVSYRWYMSSWGPSSKNKYDTITAYKGSVRAHANLHDVLEIRYGDGGNKVIGCKWFGETIYPTVDSNGTLTYLESLHRCSLNSTFKLPGGRWDDHPVIANDSIRFHIATGGQGSQLGYVVVGVKI